MALEETGLSRFSAALSLGLPSALTRDENQGIQLSFYRWPSAFSLLRGEQAPMGDEEVELFRSVHKIFVDTTRCEPSDQHKWFIVNDSRTGTVMARTDKQAIDAWPEVSLVHGTLTLVYREVSHAIRNYLQARRQRYVIQYETDFINSFFQEWRQAFEDITNRSERDEENQLARVEGRLMYLSTLRAQNFFVSNGAEITEKNKVLNVVSQGLHQLKTELQKRLAQRSLTDKIKTIHSHVVTIVALANEGRKALFPDNNTCLKCLGQRLNDLGIRDSQMEKSIVEDSSGISNPEDSDINSLVESPVVNVLVGLQDRALYRGTMCDGEGKEDSALKKSVRESRLAFRQLINKLVALHLTSRAISEAGVLANLGGMVLLYKCTGEQGGKLLSFLSKLSSDIKTHLSELLDVAETVRIDCEAGKKTVMMTPNKFREWVKTCNEFARDHRQIVSLNEKVNGLINDMQLEAFRFEDNPPNLEGKKAYMAMASALSLEKLAFGLQQTKSSRIAIQSPKKTDNLRIGPSITTESETQLSLKNRSRDATDDIKKTDCLQGQSETDKPLASGNACANEVTEPNFDSKENIIEVVGESSCYTKAMHNWTDEDIRYWESHSGLPESVTKRFDKLRKGFGMSVQEIILALSGSDSDVALDYLDTVIDEPLAKSDKLHLVLSVSNARRRIDMDQNL